jgi:sec-independent protein translocase protein TatA
MFVGHLPELIVLLVLVIFIFGAKRLPEVGSGLGKGISEFRSSISDRGDARGNETAAAPAPRLAEPSSGATPSSSTYKSEAEPLRT